MLFNKDITAYRARPAKTYDKFEYYKNGGADEVIFVFKGGGTLETFSASCLIGRRITLSFHAELPTGSFPTRLKKKIISSSNRPGRCEFQNGISITTAKSRWARPIRSAICMGRRRSSRSTRKKMSIFWSRTAPRFTRVTMAQHPFDAVGWDGYLYPFTFNAQDFEPITGTVHQPPPIHQTFEVRGYVICTFAPRLLDTHPEAVKIPWVHDNLEADEVLFYVRGNFGSRRGIESGSITLHPRGIPHGPHPGTIMASKDALRTEELAVMFDTAHTLELTEESLALDDPNYPLSWLD